jgi:alkyl-hydroperoxide reductase/thiol specific antioxidant family protein
LRPSIAIIHGLGADIAIIGTGDAASARSFQRDLNIPDVPVFVDPTRRAYELAGFHRGILTLLQPRAIWNYIRAFFVGHRAGRLQGDALQQGGVLIIEPAGSILFRHASRVSGEHPEIEQILAALRRSSSVEPSAPGGPSR